VPCNSCGVADVQAAGAQAIGFVVWAAFVASQIVGLLNTDEEWPKTVGKAGMSVAVALRDFIPHALARSSRNARSRISWT
jgi:hypothetical protein